MTKQNEETEWIQQSVMKELETGKVDQDWLVQHLSEKHNVGKGHVLYGLRELMRKGRISYSIDWKLQSEVPVD